jgi:hypothetical protein
VKRHHGGVKSTELERVVFRVDEGDGIVRDDGDITEIPGERRVDVMVKRKEELIYADRKGQKPSPVTGVTH